MNFIYERKINYYETDKMGIVHHSNYIRFLEESRLRFLEEAKMPMERIEEKGYTIPTIEVNCKYLAPVTSGDTIAIILSLKEYDGIKMTMEYEIRNAKNGQSVAKAYTKHCFTNRDLKPIQIKKYDSEIDAIFIAFNED